ncbi:hypothetical protein EKO27_g2685 [Xylaria grammica]|uniref:Uncharacterized protein n=1 Tax=Xylaria grammica TaxID=363999 RepID=A0A439DDC2_9PEZI|nr:hypothetical protein EKO27_g2685 [Xylaria grammica]
MAQPERRLPRTPNSLIFDVRARETTGKKPKFVFTEAQEAEFDRHIAAHPAEATKYWDMDDLLRRLDLDGFKGIINMDYEDCHCMIVAKVKRKISTLRAFQARQRLPNPRPPPEQPLQHTPPQSPFNPGAEPEYERPRGEFIVGYNINIID